MRAVALYLPARKVATSFSVRVVLSIVQRSPLSSSCRSSRERLLFFLFQHLFRFSKVDLCGVAVFAEEIKQLTTAQKCQRLAL
jgi:hypothetical protein